MTDQNPRSGIPPFALAMAERETARIAERSRELYNEALAAGLAAGTPADKAINDAMGLLCHLSATHILAGVDQLMDVRDRTLHPEVAFAMIFQDVTRRARIMLTGANRAAESAARIAAAKQDNHDGC